MGDEYNTRQILKGWIPVKAQSLLSSEALGKTGDLALSLDKVSEIKDNILHLVLRWEDIVTILTHILSVLTHGTHTRFYYSL